VEQTSIFPVHPFEAGIKESPSYRVLRKYSPDAVLPGHCGLRRHLI
jgi:hypothetical protein